MPSLTAHNQIDAQLERLQLEIQQLRSTHDLEMQESASALAALIAEGAESHEARTRNLAAQVRNSVLHCVLTNLHPANQLNKESAVHAEVHATHQGDEAAVRKQRDKFEGITKQCIQDYDVQMCTMQDEIESIEIHKLQCGSNLAVLRDHFRVVSTSHIVAEERYGTVRICCVARRFQAAR